MLNSFMDNRDIMYSGADDDASGTSLVLAVARQIHLNRLVFSRKLGKLFLFSQLFFFSLFQIQSKLT